MKQHLILSLLVAAGLFLPANFLQAQSLRNFWTNAPDSLFPYLNAGKRTELLDYVSMGVKAETKNSFNEMVTINTLTPNFMEVAICDNLLIQIKQLPSTGSDSLFCVVKTFGNQEKESTITLYDANWQTKQQLRFSPLQNIGEPGNMSTEQYNQLKQLTSFYMLKATLTPTATDLILTYEAPMLSTDERKKLNSLQKQTILKWNGETFK